MPTIYSAKWLIPSSSTFIEDGAVAIDSAKIVGLGTLREVRERFPKAENDDFGNAVIIPGLVNTHTHLELTAMRGYLEQEETNFFAWLRKLTIARMELMTPDDIEASALFGACEAVRAGITSVGDASDSAINGARALRKVGLRGIVFQESFGPDARLIKENLDKLRDKIVELREVEDVIVRVGVSPHAPYTVCGPQLELIADYAQDENLPLMMHAAESAAEEEFIRDGCGLFAEGLRKRSIEWNTPGTSVIQHLNQTGILSTSPLLAHCIRVDDEDIETLAQTASKVAHCPKSNAKLGHGRAPFAKFIEGGIVTGLGSDSVASNNTCDILEEARFATLFARVDRQVSTKEVFDAATKLGAACLGFDGVGELVEGSDADFAIVSMEGMHQLPSYDPLSTLIFSSSGRDVQLTVIAGREVFRDGRVLSVDEERLRARMGEIRNKLAGV